MNIYNYIETPAQMVLIHTHLSQQKIVGIDTEFVRRYTFWPKLSLVQISTLQNVYVIEPAAIDKSWFQEFLSNRKIKKVFHSCRQDVEALYWFCKAVPCNIFDTQVAYEFLGLTHQISYAQLVKDLLALDLPKDHQWSDWDKRPLSDAQLLYAAHDAQYLIPLAEVLEEKLKQKRRFSWFVNVARTFDDLSTHMMDPTSYFIEKIYTGHMTPQIAAAIHAVVLWREAYCRTHNVLRGNVITDQMLRQLSLDTPLEQLSVGSRWRQQVYQILHDHHEIFPYVWISPPVGHAIKAIKKILEKSLHGCGIPRKYMATQEQILGFLLKNDHNIPLFQGWRQKILGHAKQELLAIQQKLELP